MKPSILLVRPQMGENIGAAARAMANFGLGELRLVAPRDGWPNVKASDTAGRALNVIDDAKTYASVGDALADCQFVLATTARDRVMNLPVYDVREAMHELHARTTRGDKCAVMFGPERTGLENEDLALADAIVTIPVAPEYASLNVGQAVVVCAYEWFQEVIRVEGRESSGGTGGAAGAPLPTGEATRLNERSEFSRSGEGAFEQVLSRPHPDLQPHHLSPNAIPNPSYAPREVVGANPTSPAGRGGAASPPAPKSQLLGLFTQLETALDDVNFWRVPEKKEIMWRNIRATLTRAGLTEQEIATWRGMIRSLKSEV